MMSARGFTLLEMLAALAVFAMIAAVIATITLGAGEGFEELKSRRDRFAEVFALGRQMRLDVTALSRAESKSVQTLVLKSSYAAVERDALWLLVREADRPYLSLVHYWLDDHDGRSVLVREVVPAIEADSGQPPLRWDVASSESFSAEALDEEGRWQRDWNSGESGSLPRALRIVWQGDAGRRELTFPIFIDMGAS